MATNRKNQARLSSEEWDVFLDALEAIRTRGARKPTYADFVKVHVDAMIGPGMHSWGVHSMAGMRGRNFLTWHRWYLLQFERRLQEENPDVAIPYWDWIADPRIPARMSRPQQLRRWRIARQWDASFLPDRSDLSRVTRRFWLHHANVDRIWARWQERHPRQRPRNADEELKPKSLFGVKVSETLALSRLGYRYT